MNNTAPVVLVTGASRGIGRAIAIEFGRRGFHVAVNYRRGAREAAETLAAIEAMGATASLHLADVSQPVEAQRMIAEIMKRHRRLDVLVNNAGITRDGYLMNMRQEDWDAVLAIDLNSVYHCCKYAATVMAGARHGVIINIGSSSALSARPGQVNYGAAKSALLGLSRSLARELAPKGVRVLIVAPGFTSTDMTNALSAQAANEALGRIPLGRWGFVEEIARTVGFFASADARCYSGQTIVIDGGRTAYEMEEGL